MRRMYLHPGEYRIILLANYLCIGFVPGDSVLRTPRGSSARAPECPKSVLRVSPECPGHLFDTPGTLSGHFLDTLEPGARRAPETPVDTPSDTPRFQGHSRGHSLGHFRPEGPERLL